MTLFTLTHNLTNTMSSRLLRLFAGSTLLRTQAIRSIATPMRGTIAVRSKVQLAAAAAGPLKFSHPPTRFLIPRSPIRRAFTTFSNKEIPPCGKQCGCSYDAEKESMISVQRWTVVCIAGLAMSFASIFFLDLVRKYRLIFSFLKNFHLRLG